MTAEVEFHTNPNGKLTNEHFGDTRLRDDLKFVQDRIYEITYRGKYMGTARLVAMHHFRFKQLRDTYSFIYCGHFSYYQAGILKKMYPKFEIHADTEFTTLVFKWTARKIEVQEQVLMDYWEKVKDSEPYYQNTH